MDDELVDFQQQAFADEASADDISLDCEDEEAQVDRAASLMIKSLLQARLIHDLSERDDITCLAAVLQVVSDRLDVITTASDLDARSGSAQESSSSL